MRVNKNTIKFLQNSQVKPVGSDWHLTAPQMTRNAYELFAKVVAALRGEWQRSKQAHVFNYDPTTAIAQIIETGEAPDINPLAFFPTPLVEVDSMIDWSGLPPGSSARKGIRVLEPEAGDGRIARRIREYNPTAQIDCFEVDPFNRRILAQLDVNLIGEDFLASSPPKHGYDYILMNPPFNGREYQQHIYRAWKWLSRNGVLVSVLPAEFRRDPTFRNFVFEYGEAADCAPFETTNVKCSTIKMEKFDTARFWEPTDSGFQSHYQECVLIALDCDRIFCDKLQTLTSATAIAEWVDVCMERKIVEEECSLFYDHRVRQQVVRHYAEEREVEPAIADERGQFELVF